jgi:L-threonylcarbamoyladenylate synthase
MNIIPVDPNSLEVPRRAIEVLQDRGLVAFPTDTYYALGALALDEAAVERVFAAKRRPRDDALPVFVCNRDQWRSLVADLPDAALRLADRFWPGALTIVCRRAPRLPALLAGGGETIGVREPALPLAGSLCQALESPIAGTSANSHGAPPSVSAAQVALDLGSAVDLILDGGHCPLARPSTVIDVSRSPAVLVREGVVSAAEIRAILGEVAVAARAGRGARPQ